MLKRRAICSACGVNSKNARNWICSMRRNQIALGILNGQLLFAYFIKEKQRVGWVLFFMKLFYYLKVKCIEFITLCNQIKVFYCTSKCHIDN